MRVRVVGLMLCFAIELTACRSQFAELDAGRTIDAATDSTSDASVTTSRHWETVGLAAYGRRVASRAAYDPIRNRLLIYGGEETLNDGTIVDRDDLWSYDGRWQLLCKPCAPGSRQQFQLAFDSTRDRLVLFGGRSSRGVSPTNDLWEWDGVEWTAKTASPNDPTPRASAAFVYDTIRMQLLLFGGVGQPGPFNDLHSHDGESWTEISTLSPPDPGNSQGGILGVFDENRGGLLVYGGDAAGVVSDQAQVFDGSEWSVLCSDCNGEGGDNGILGGAMVYDDGLKATLLIGGRDSSDRVGGTREFRSTGLALLSDAPDPIANGAVGFDESRNRVVLIGGAGDDCDVGGLTSVCLETREYVAD